MEYDLTKRELEVLALIVEGLSNPEIGARLSISKLTVNNHLRSIYAKLGVNSRLAAAVKAVREALV